MLMRKENYILCSSVMNKEMKIQRKLFPFFHTTVLNCSVCRLSSSVIAVCVSELSHLTPGMT